MEKFYLSYKRYVVFLHTDMHVLGDFKVLLSQITTCVPCSFHDSSVKFKLLLIKSIKLNWYLFEYFYLVLLLSHLLPKFLNTLEYVLDFAFLWHKKRRVNGIWILFKLVTQPCKRSHEVFKV